jgi:hypothetical protein
MERPLSLKLVVVLALAQALGGLLRALNWVHIGVDLFGQGVLLLPLVGSLALMRGMFIAAVALLYVSFAVGALWRRSWSRGACLAAALLNLFLSLGGLVQGAPVIQGIAWSVVPIILLCYLFSQAGRGALKPATA